jgi:chromosome segregation ATPase
MQLTEEQWRIIENVVGILVGAGSSVGIQWLAKIKTKTEAKDTHTDNLLKGNDKLMDRTQEFVDMLQESWSEERKSWVDERKDFRAEIDDLRKQIATLRNEHRVQIESLIKDNDALSLRVEQLVSDNHELNIQVVKLTSSNEGLNKQITSLKKRLSQYETDMNDTGDHKAIKMG